MTDDKPKVWTPGRTGVNYGGANLSSTVGVFRDTLAKQFNESVVSMSPFELYNASAGATLKVGVTPGTVNGIYPTIGGVTIDTVPAPLATITDTRHVFLQVDCTFGNPDVYTAQIVSSTTPTPPNAPNYTGSGFRGVMPLGSVTVSGGAITNITQSGIRPDTPSINLGCEADGASIYFWKD